MSLLRIIIVLVLSGTIVFATACTTNEADAATEKKCFDLPIGTHLPRVTQSDTTLWLSFVHSPTVGHDTLGIYSWQDQQWSGPENIIHGDNWFVNWADFPSVVPIDDYLNESYYFYHWLQYSGEGTYDYDIMFNTQHWYSSSLPSALHHDGVAAEHGFLSSAELPNGILQVSWLDGRYTKQEQGAAAGAEEGTKKQSDHDHGGGAMTLRTKALSDSTSVELDHRVCDCCNTATVATDSLVMVAYRDRSEHEIRDISYVIKRAGSETWSTPKLVHADNWEISGCPVNGPALAANEQGDIAIVWYTAPAGRAQILFSRYDPSLDLWKPPTLLDDNSPLGRVDLQLGADGTAYATGLTASDDSKVANLTLWTIRPHQHNAAAGRNIDRAVLSKTSTARSSGFPKIALFQDRLFWSRTVVGASKQDHYVEICQQPLW